MRIELNKKEYADYYSHYINLSKDLDLISGLKSSSKALLDLFNSIPAHKLEYRYAEGKWTVKELLQHLIDSERIFTYRALRFAREDSTNIPGYEHDDYIVPSRANKRSIDSLIEEYKALRASSIQLFESFDEDMLLQIGSANSSNVSVRAIGYIMIGHETHHCNVIKERYL